MYKQKENFKALVKGNSIDKICQALRMVHGCMVEELMNDYKCSTIEELAFHLQ
jgi:hypothetical protein